MSTNVWLVKNDVFTPIQGCKIAVLPPGTQPPQSSQEALGRASVVLHADALVGLGTGLNLGAEGNMQSSNQWNPERQRSYQNV